MNSIEPMIPEIYDLICKKADGKLKTYFDRFKERKGASPELIAAAYYVWRKARFLTKQDVTEPTAAYVVTKDMDRDDIAALDGFAEAIADSQLHIHEEEEAGPSHMVA